MCGVVAAFNPNGVDMIAFRKLLILSSDEGVNGISWFQDGEIKTFEEERDASIFKLSTIQTVAVIGHSRCEGSDLEANTPVTGKDHAIAHNGTVSQLPAWDWEQAYGLGVTSENDTDLLVKAFEHDLHPLEAFPKANVAAVMLANEREGPELGYFRNGKPSLWFDYEDDDNCCWVASSENIFRAAGLAKHPKRCEAGHHYRVTTKTGYMAYQFAEGFE